MSQREFTEKTLALSRWVWGVEAKGGFLDNAWGCL